MNAQPISLATLKKWEAIACDRLNHALVVYKRDDGLFVVDVFEVLDVCENYEGLKCLRAVSLATKYNGPQFSPLSESSSGDSKREYVVEIPLNSIVESHRYEYGTGTNDLDIRRYYESIAKVRQRQHIETAVRSPGNPDRLPEFAKSPETRTGDFVSPRLGCALWLLCAGVWLALALWIF